MRDFALTFINGRRHEIRGPLAFLMLSDYLRYDARLTGTKVVCSEGDCGACAVLLGTPDGNTIRYRPITSCIAMMGQLDGAHIITVEGLSGAAAEKLHPVQESMVACNGAQCGYCTPGIVVSLAGMCEQKKSCKDASAKFSEGEVRQGLTGNLCRCTGYSQILDAAVAIEPGTVQAMNTLYPSADLLPTLIETGNASLLIEAAGKKFFKPVTVLEACTFKQNNLGAIVLAGGTDIGVLVNKQRIDPQAFLCLTGLCELSKVETTEREIIIGGRASLAAFEATCETALPDLFPIMQRHGSPLIRNAGTLAGNIVNGSPIGDTMPALMVLNAEVELTGTTGSRRVDMNDFYIGYRKTVLAPDELLTRIFIPRVKDGELLRLFKISKRWDLDISTFTAAFWIKLGKPAGNNGNGNAHAPIIEEIRITYGGVGPMIVRLPKTEALLKGEPFTEELMAKAGQLATEEITPISDVRSSADYRFQLAENIPLKLFHELTTDH